MNLDDYWQENKRFVMSVAVGIIVFFIGTSVIDSVYGSERRLTQQAIMSTQRKLKEPLFASKDRAQAQDENDALREAFDKLAAVARFKPLPRFTLSADKGSAANQYRRAFADVIEDIGTRANRANVQIDASLGMPKLSPTRDVEIVRYLEALDLVEQVLDYCILAGIDRVDRIQCRLDPLLNDRRGLDRVERTRVTFTMTGTSLAVDRVLTWSQRSPHDARQDPRRGRTLVVDDLEIVPSRGRRDEVRADVGFVVARLAKDANSEEPDPK